jgi:K+-transporting ATPase ATPase C chain
VKRDVTSAIVAVVVFTVLLGRAYPLVMTGVAQVLFPGKSDGSQIERDGRVIGSELLAQDFKGKPEYFQSRPSVTGYSADVTYLNNLGANNAELAAFFAKTRDRYLRFEGRYTPGLTVRDVPVDAVTTSASGVDPHISLANARIQANRVAEARGIELERVLELVDEHTDGRALGFLGEPGVNVLRLNLALDDEAA